MIYYCVYYSNIPLILLHSPGLGNMSGLFLLKFYLISSITIKKVMPVLILC